jgi:peptidyl-prolyl cis-trans isomerase C
MSTLRIFLAAIIAVCYLTGCGSSDEPAANETFKSPAADHDHGHAHGDEDHHDHDHGPKPGEPYPASALQPAQAAPPAPQAVTAAPKVDADTVVVSVNGEKLVYGELNVMVQQMMGQQLAQIPPQMRQQLMQQLAPRMQVQAIDRFIGGEVLEAEADKQKVTAPEEKIKEQLDALRGQLPETVTWDDALTQMGTTEERIRGEISREIKIRALIEKHLATLPKKSTAELKAVYDKDSGKYATESNASARHILIGTDGDNDVAKAAKLESIKKLRQEILDGGDFAEIAKKNSDCPSKERGGDLGSFGKGRMVPPFEKAVFEQELNKVGDVVETRFGYHLIEVTAREESQKRTFEQVKDEIEAEINRDRDGKAVEAYVTSLRKGAKIVYGKGYEPSPASAPAQAVP